MKMLIFQFIIIKMSFAFKLSDYSNSLINHFNGIVFLNSDFI